MLITGPTAVAATHANASSTKTTITWWASPINTSGPDLRTVLITAFEKAYPNITVKLETAPTNTDTNRADLVTAISGGASTPDVFMGDVIWPGQFGAHQLALPLSKYLPKSFWSRFASGLVAGATYDGQVYGAPFFQDEGFLYYRTDLLKAAGMAVPTTWEQLQSDAIALVKAGKVKYGFVFEGDSYEGGTCDFMEYYADTGGQVLNSTDTVSELNVADVTKVLTLVRGLVTSGASPSAVDTFQEPQAMTAFADGQAAFLRNWDYAYSTSQASGSKVIGDVGVAPLPTFQGEPYPGYSNIGGWNLYVNPHSKNVAADLDFINFITGTEAQTIEAHPPFSEIPTNASVRANPAIKALNPPFAILSKTKLVPRPAQNPNYPKISQAIYTNFNAAIAGSASPSSAASAMASQLKSALSSSGL
jgi:multiple sugar transport system substrate-binding protein